MRRREREGWAYLTRSLCFVAALLLLTAGAARAEKNDWADGNYDFSAVQRVLLLDLAGEELPENIIERHKAEENYARFAKEKLGVRVIPLEEAARLMGPQIGVDVAALLASDRAKAAALIRTHAQVVADIWVEGRVETWEDDSYISPAHTEWEQRAYTRIIKDSEGKTLEETYYVTVPVTYPACRVWYSDIHVVFEVHEAKSGRLIMGREDDRQRDGTNAQDGMFKRICKSFYSDLVARIKG